MDEVAYRKRLDGGCTIARGSGFVVPVVPDSLRYLREFSPTLKKERGNMKLRLNAQSFKEWTGPRRWPLDRPSPFESDRVLDPPPDQEH